METNNLSTFERTKAKREALNKLDFLIEAELKRLYAISPDEPNLEEFEVCITSDYFSDNELEEIRENIAKLKKLSSKDEKEREKAKKFLKIILLCRPIICPWENQEKA